MCDLHTAFAAALPDLSERRLRLFFVAAWRTRFGMKPKRVELRPLRRCVAIAEHLADRQHPESATLNAALTDAECLLARCSGTDSPLWAPAYAAVSMLLPLDELRDCAADVLRAMTRRRPYAEARIAELLPCLTTLPGFTGRIWEQRWWCPGSAAVAHRAYLDRAFNLPAVVHQLERSGAPSELIQHLRTGPHCRGCRAVDALLMLEG